MINQWAAYAPLQQKEIVMFSDPLSIANSGTTLSLPRVDAGMKAGTYMVNVPGDYQIEFNIRNSEYVNKSLKRTFRRHNIELKRTDVIDATSITPQTNKIVKVYMVIEHDDNVTAAEIKSAADQVAHFVIDASNGGYVDKLINNEG